MYSGAISLDATLIHYMSDIRLKASPTPHHDLNLLVIKHLF